MPLQKFSDHICFLPTQPKLERPLLAYIRGDRLSLAVDAGYSVRHLSEFYSGLDAAGLPRPDFTALTHWHCDHANALYAASGLGIACGLSNKRLCEHEIKCKEPGYRDYMISRDPFFAAEYPEGEPITVVPAPLEFDGGLALDLGGVTAELFLTEAPHGVDNVCILVREERTLFLGDAIYGDPDTGWGFDPARLEALILSIERADCDTCIASHNSPHGKASMLRLLRRKLESL